MNRMLKAEKSGLRGLACLTLAILLLCHIRSASAQQRDPQEAKARSFIDSVAATIYKAAWPSATYRSWHFDGFSRAQGGFDATVTLDGISSFDKGDLWIQLRIPVRNGIMAMPQVLDHNAILRAPFETTKTLAQLAAQLAQDYASSNGGSSAPASQSTTPLSSGQGAPPSDDREEIQQLLQSWRRTIVANDATAEAALYAPVVHDYYGRSQVTNAAVRDDKAAFIDNGNQVLELTLDGLTFESLTPNNARIEAVKNVTWKSANGNIVSQRRIAHIGLQHDAVGWKISGERDTR